jgi:hypothetical protein
MKFISFIEPLDNCLSFVQIILCYSILYYYAQMKNDGMM